MMGLRFVRFDTTEEEIKCLNFIENLTASYFGDESFIWTPVFENWETNRVIGEL